MPPGLYALCDDRVAPTLPMVQKAHLLLSGGVRVLQLRMKATPTRTAVGIAREVVALCHRAGGLCLVNDRVDWALISGADGVHVGEEDLPARDARALLGPDRLLGVTVRDLAMIEQAGAAGADYVGLGPIFPTRTKVVDHRPLGLERLAELVRASPLPVVAISGIGLANIERVAAAGAHGAAVASGLFEADDVPAMARRLSEAFARGKGG